jgi:ArsR family transcriptional regulator
MTTAEAASLFAAVGDPTRLGILRQLMSEGERCVCKLDVSPDVAPNLLSYHLKVLREVGLVVATRRGRWIDYALAPDAHTRLHAAIPSPSGQS